MQQFQAVILMQQFDKLVQETARRRENADYLSAHLKQIPGIQPARLPENSRAVWHLYPFRYDAEQFSGLARDKFLIITGSAQVTRDADWIGRNLPQGVHATLTDVTGVGVFTPDVMRRVPVTVTSSTGCWLCVDGCCATASSAA